MVNARRKRLVLVALALATTVSGCSKTTVAKLSDDQLTVTETEYQLTPQVIRAPAGKLIITVKNRGRLPHALWIRREGRVIRKLQTLRPGESRITTLTVRPGAYRLYCPLSNHQVLGEFGTLAVKG